MNATVAMRSGQPSLSFLLKTDRNVAEVYAAPMTELIAAAQKMTPKMRRPASPIAFWNATPAGLRFGSAMSRVKPDAATPRIARNST